MTVKPPLGSYTYVALCRKRVARAFLLMSTAGGWRSMAQWHAACADREDHEDGSRLWRHFYGKEAEKCQARAAEYEAQALRAWARLPPEVLAFCPTPDDGERINLLWRLDCLLDELERRR